MSRAFSDAQITASLKMSQGDRQKAAAFLLRSSTLASAPMTLEEKYDRDEDGRWYLAFEFQNPRDFDQDQLEVALDQIGPLPPDDMSLPFKKFDKWADNNLQGAYALFKEQDKTGLSWYAFEAKYGDQMRKIAASPEAEQFGKWQMINQRLISKLRS
jgi:hypothetical protein